MYPLDDNIFDKPETSTEEILSKTQASFTLLQTETPSLISESPSETPVSSYKSSTEKQAVVAKHFQSLTQDQVDFLKHNMCAW